MSDKYKITNIDNDGANVQEIFGYDALNRLSKYQVNPHEIINYYNNGNIQYKGAVNLLMNYEYAPDEAHHTVSQIEDPSATISNEMQQIAYNEFHQPETITQGNYELTYTYGPDQQRRTSTLKENGTVIKKIVYSSAGCEIVTVGTNQYEVYYLGGNMVNVLHNEVNELYYLHTDYLGSILEF